ncbi:hypothetical protein [Methanobacterium paludis]|uniref:Uncharacterized protein n=1 Tax=Methanobacterium paludis (strain DSM 25820 / JCM 18151 / SWAN1) TaxID=868131 RepID=F6D2B0_METPW|nr:hypothetical protein [Methanobacterium paludis]AEG18627.1 hypothetical protein MSWAN_1616 [Methanobacterium paludis]
MDKIILNGNVAVDAKGVKEGDTVLVATTASGDKVACPLTSIKAGDQVAVVKLQNGDKMAVKVLNKVCVKITDAFSRIASPAGETFNLGTFTFTWDGVSKVYILKSCQSEPVIGIYADDLLTASTSKGKVSCDYGGVWSKNPMELSSILNPGDNNINVTVTDLYGGVIGTPSLFIVQYSD